MVIWSHSMRNVMFLLPEYLTIRTSHFSLNGTKSPLTQQYGDLVPFNEKCDVLIARIPDNKNITFLIEWDQITTDAAISYTRLLLKHWESVQTGAIENISNIEERINTQQATEQEWTFIKEVINKITTQTKEDLEKKPDRRWRPNNQQNPQTQQTTDTPEASTSFFQNPPPLPQRQRRTGDFRGNHQ